MVLEKSGSKAMCLFELDKRNSSFLPSDDQLIVWLTASILSKVIEVLPITEAAIVQLF